MEIPDLDYSVKKQKQIDQEMDIFYSVQDSDLDQSTKQIEGESSYEENFKPIIQDFILKKTMNLAWNKRYFVLTAHRLLYYDDDQNKQIKGCFNFNSLYQYNLKVKEEQNNLKMTFVVNFIFNNQKYTRELLILSFQQVPHRFSLWRKYINTILNKLNKKSVQTSPRIMPFQIIYLQQKIHCHNFWNRIKISLNELAQYANHLDIVFFKSKKPIAAFHRVLMRSNFDHVAILFKDSYNRVLILQAIQSRGVWINQWKQMLPIFKQHYDQIAIRKLILRKESKLDFNKLEKHIDNILGKKYELSISKLMISQTTQTQSYIEQEKKQKTEQRNKQNLHANNKVSNQQIKQPRKQKTYFCSQLVADIYIKTGLIKGRKRNEFWPRDFENNSITLQDGAHLTPLMFLQFWESSDNK